MSNQIHTSEPPNTDFNPRQTRSIYDIIRDLSKPFPKMEKQRRQGGKEITYISWYNVTRVLDQFANGWWYEIRNIQVIAGKVILTVRLTIPANEGLVYREATGQEDETVDSWGDSTSNAESMALRRAAAKFGLGRYLYDKDSQNAPVSTSNRSNDTRQGQTAQTPNKPQQSANTGANYGGGMTPKQLSAAIAIITKNNLSEIDLALEYSNDRVETFDKLDKAESKKLLDYLFSIGK